MFKLPQSLQSLHNLHCIKLALRDKAIPSTTFSPLRFRTAASKATKDGSKTAPHKPTALPRLFQGTESATKAPGFTPTPDQSRSSAVARQLWELGHREIFRAPSHVGFLTASYILGFGCVMGTVSMFLSQHWRDDKNTGLPFFVPGAYRISMVFLSFLGWWAIFRSTGQIISIDLVSPFRMAVKVRRAFPILKPKIIYTEPYNLVLPSRMVAQLAIPQWVVEPASAMETDALSQVSRWFKQAAWNTFSSNRKLFTHEGFMDVSVKGRSGVWKLDTTGRFDANGRSLIDMSSFDN